MQYHKTLTNLIEKLNNSNIQLGCEVAERKLAEEKLQLAKTKIEETNRIKTEFLSNMSHELRTPLNGILGFSQILEEINSDSEEREYASRISECAGDLLSMIDDILNFSEIEKGQLDFDYDTYQISGLLDSIELMLRPIAENKGLEFLIEYDIDKEGVIYTDVNRIRQCLLHLVHNAVKYTEEGYVKICIWNVTENDRKYIRFDIEDTGIGIAKDKLQRIFEAFRQADGSESRQYGGIGLGLSIALRLAVLMHSRIEVMSQEGQGSVFSLIIPVITSRKEQFPIENQYAVISE